MQAAVSYKLCALMHKVDKHSHKQGSLYLCSLQGRFPVLHGCNLESVAVDAVLDACRTALSNYKGSMDGDKDAIGQLAQDSSKHVANAASMRRMSILQLRIQERRILNKTVSVLVSQRRQIAPQRQAVQKR